MGDEIKLLEGMGCGKQEQSLEESELYYYIIFLHDTKRRMVMQSQYTIMLPAIVVLAQLGATHGHWPPNSGKLISLFCHKHVYKIPKFHHRYLPDAWWLLSPRVYSDQ